MTPTAAGSVSHLNLRLILRRTWWILFPGFTALTLRLSAERACGDPYDLLPAITHNPAWAWPIAVVYLLAHLWMLAAYLMTATACGAMAPSWADVRRSWGRDIVPCVLMGAAFVVEYSPVPLWRIIGRSVGCG